MSFNRPTSLRVIQTLHPDVMANNRNAHEKVIHVTDRTMQSIHRGSFVWNNYTMVQISIPAAEMIHMGQHVTHLKRAEL